MKNLLANQNLRVPEVNLQHQNFLNEPAVPFEDNLVIFNSLQKSENDLFKPDINRKRINLKKSKYWNSDSRPPKLNKRRWRRSKFGSNDAFSPRQDLNQMVNMAQNAFQMFSMVQSFFGGGGGGGSRPSSNPVKSDPDRIDKVVTTTSDGDDIDLAMGTLMAYGGKYLRELVNWAWELSTNTPVEKIGDDEDVVVVETVEKVDKVTEKVDKVDDVESTVSVVKVAEPVEIAKPAVSPLKLLTPEELEELGLKAVSAGAEAVKLQQAFATAQINGDWKPLEDAIKAALGPNSIPQKAGSSGVHISTFGGSKPSRPSSVKVSSVPVSSSSSSDGVSVSTVHVPVTQSIVGDSSSSGSSILSGLTNIVSNLIGGGSSGQSVNKVGVAAGATEGVSTSEVPTGLLGQAQTYIKRVEKVINGPDPNFPSDDPMDASVVTRFIKEFKLQKEAMALQYQVNNVLQTVNKFIGDEDTAKDPYSNTGGSTSSVSTSSAGSTGGVLGILGKIPQAIGSALGFATPQASAQNKLGVAAGEADPGTSSEVTSLDTSSIATIGLLGTAAIGTVLYSIHARKSPSQESINRRVGTPMYQTRFYKRSADPSFEDLNSVNEPEFKVLKQQPVDWVDKIHHGYLKVGESLKHCDEQFESCLNIHAGSLIKNRGILGRSREICGQKRRKCYQEVFA